MREIQAALQRHGKTMALLQLLFFCSWTGAQARSEVPGAGDGKALLTVLSHHFADGLLHIDYEVRYTGMTKVRLYNEEGLLVWSGQYVNDKEGAWQVHLRMSLLPAGPYRFEFEYKGKTVTYELVH
jgi:hypothetical protein